MQNVWQRPRTAAPIRLRLYVWLLASFWTVAIAIVLTWELSDEVDQVYVEAHSEAWGIWQKEDAIYRWAVTRGNIYVPLLRDSVGPAFGVGSRSRHHDAVGRQVDAGQPGHDHASGLRRRRREAVRRGRLSSLRPVNPGQRARPVGEAGPRGLRGGPKGISVRKKPSTARATCG